MEVLGSGLLYFLHCNLNLVQLRRTLVESRHVHRARPGELVIRQTSSYWRGIIDCITFHPGRHTWETHRPCRARQSIFWHCCTVLPQQLHWTTRVSSISLQICRVRLTRGLAKSWRRWSMTPKFGIWSESVSRKLAFATAVWKAWLRRSFLIYHHHLSLRDCHCPWSAFLSLPTAHSSRAQWPLFREKYLAYVLASTHRFILCASFENPSIC